MICGEKDVQANNLKVLLNEMYSAIKKLVLDNLKVFRSLEQVEDLISQANLQFCFWLKRFQNAFVKANPKLFPSIFQNW